MKRRILALQKCLVRIISGAHRISHADPLFSGLGFLKIDDLFAQAVRVFSYKMSRNLLPGGASLHFDKVNHRYNTRGAMTNFSVGSSDGRSIRNIAPVIWNSLPTELKQSPSIATFKDHSKRGLLAPYAAFACLVPHCPSCAPG